MKKILKWIKRNLGLFIVLMLTLVLLAFIVIIFIKLLMEKSSDNYGNRLEGIEEVEISSKTHDSVEEEVKGTELAESINIRVQGKIIYTTIVLKKDTSVKKAKNIASETLDNYSKDEQKFYDFSFFLKWEGEEEDVVITGNKHHSLETITWINS